jgi:hypothetical protein
MYELMADKKFTYHFKYTNALEQLSLAKGAKFNLNATANQLQILYYPLEINVPYLAVSLPDEPWFYIDGYH